MTYRKQIVVFGDEEPRRSFDSISIRHPQWHVQSATQDAASVMTVKAFYMSALPFQHRWVLLHDLRCHCHSQWETDSAAVTHHLTTSNELPTKIMRPVDRGLAKNNKSQGRTSPSIAIVNRGFKMFLPVMQLHSGYIFCMHL